MVVVANVYIIYRDYVQKNKKKLYKQIILAKLLRRELQFAVIKTRPSPVSINVILKTSNWKKIINLHFRKMFVSFSPPANNTDSEIH